MYRSTQSPIFLYARHTFSLFGGIFDREIANNRQGLVLTLQEYFKDGKEVIGRTRRMSILTADTFNSQTLSILKL